MQKFIAHNIYGTNEYGAAVTVVLPTGEPKAVYLATDVDQMRANFDAAAEGHAQVVADKDARIAELERELADAKSLARSLDKSNDRLRQKIDRLSH